MWNSSAPWQPPIHQVYSVGERVVNLRKKQKNLRQRKRRKKITYIYVRTFVPTFKLDDILMETSRRKIQVNWRKKRRGKVSLEQVMCLHIRQTLNESVKVLRCREKVVVTNFSENYISTRQRHPYSFVLLAYSLTKAKVFWNVFNWSYSFRENFAGAIVSPEIAFSVFAEYRYSCFKQVNLMKSTR